MFNLEKAINDWRKELEKHPGLEPGYIEELEAHLRDKIEILIEDGVPPEEAFEEAASSQFDSIEELADEYYLSRTPSKTVLNPSWKTGVWNPVLLPNYLKVSLRNLLRNKGYALINISGLAVSLACCLLIGLWLHYQLGFDRFHSHSDQIYRVVRSTSAMSAAPIGPAMKREYPAVERQTRIMDLQNGVFHDDAGNRFEQTLFFVDPEFFDIFSFELIRGNPQAALRRPDGIVLTESLVMRLFGTREVIGRSLEVEEGDDTYKFTVTGVLEDPPKNSHLQFDALGSFLLIEQVISRVDNWETNWLFTYLLLDETSDYRELESNLPQLFERHTGEASSIWSLQPLHDVYLRSAHFSHDIATMGNIRYVYIFGTASVLLLLIACVNFVNLSTARSLRRAKEIGVRKTLGATWGQLMRQFLGESMLTTALSLATAGIIVWMAFPLFSELVEYRLTIGPDEIAFFILTATLFMLVAGLIAGGYPAIILPSLQTVNALANRIKLQSGGMWLRKSLIVIQFSISIGLIAGMLLIHSQLEYLKNKNLGFSAGQTLVLPIGDSARLSERSETIKQELKKHPGFEKVAAGGSIPGRPVSDFYYRLEGMPEDFERMPGIDTYFIDMDFIDVLNINIRAGRSFSADFATDSTAFVLNRSAVDRLSTLAEISGGSLVGRELYFYTPGSTGWEIYKKGRIIGIVDDFHYLSLRDGIGPLVLQVYPPAYDHILANIHAGEADIAQAVDHARSLWNKFAPDKPFEYYFLDERFDSLYRSEQQMAELFLYFSIIAIIISALGLFGLTAYSIEQRTKEIGIRKVLGASVESLLVLLSKDTIRLVLIAFVLTVPATYLLAGKWLRNFAYHIPINLWYFAIAGSAALLIAILSVSWQSARAALTDPVNSLRSD